MSDRRQTFDGRCSCGNTRFRMNRAPLFIHCCHCTWCQRESGSAFTVNAMIEASQVEVTQGQPVRVTTPTNSGKGQEYFRCPDCFIALWSIYTGAGEQVLFVRVGSLEEAGTLSPDIHIFTESKLPWVNIPENDLSVPRYYNRNKYWPAASLDRFARLPGS